MAKKGSATEKRLFLGRIQEQKQFQSTLAEFTKETDSAAMPYVCLISGEGGMGKSALSRRFQQIIREEKPFSGQLQTLHIDWEDERKKIPGLQVSRDLVDAEHVFRAFHAAVIRRKWGRQFAAYRKAMQETKEVEKKVAELMTAGDGFDELAMLRSAGVPAVARLIRWKAPFIGDPGEQLVQSLLSVGVQVAAEQLTILRSGVETHLRARMKANHFDHFLNPNEQLAHALARGLAKVAGRQRLVVFLDSYEIIDRVDVWVRSVIREAGPRVMWVISGRSDLVHSRQFGDEYFKGYADDWSEHLLAFNMWPLSVADIMQYFELQGNALNKEEGEALSRVTQGRPLAIQAVANQLQAGAALKEILQDIKAHNAGDHVVRHMTERYLQHVVAEGDKQAVYALALADGDVTTVRAMLTPEGKKSIRLDALLRRLERDYAIVDAERGRLHDDPRTFLREYLKVDVRRSDQIIQDLAAKGAQVCLSQIHEIESELQTVIERCTDDNWVNAVVRRADYLLWLNEREAWTWIMPRLVEGWGYNPQLCRTLLFVLTDWQDHLSENGNELTRRCLLLQQDILSLEDEHKLLDLFAQMEERGWLNGRSATLSARDTDALSESRSDAENDERRAILSLQAGQLAFRQNDLLLARTHYERAETQIENHGITVLQTRLAEQVAILGRLWLDHFADQETIFVEAEALFRKVSKWLPDSAWAWADLGRFVKHQGRLDEALQFLEKSLSIDGKQPQLLLLVGELLLALERFEDAIEIYQKAGKSQSGFVEPRLALADLYAKQGEITEAEKFYRLAAKMDPTMARPHIHLADLWLKQGRYEDAFESYRKAQELQPELGRPDTGIGLIHLQRGEWDAAETSLNIAISKGEHTAEVFNGLGQLNEAIGQPDDAIHAYQEVLTLDTETSHPYLAIGRIYTKLERWNEAQQAFQRALIRQPDMAEAQLALAQTQEALGQFVNALETYETLPQELRDRDIDHKRAQLFLLQNRFDEALEIFEQLSGSDNTNPEVILGLGEARLGLAHYADALLAFDQIQESSTAASDHLVAAFIGRGRVHLSCRRYEQAGEAFELALTEDPFNVDARCGLGDIAYAEGASEKAYNLYRAVLDDNQEAALAMIGIGRVFLASQQYDRALTACRYAINLEPHLPDTYVLVGEVRLKQKELYQARRSFQKAIELNRFLVAAHIGYGSCLKQLSEPAAALDAFETALTLDPASDIDHLILAELYAELRQWGKSLAYYDNLQPDIPTVSDVPFYTGIGKVYLALDRTDEAIEMFRVAQQLDDGNPVPYMGIGQALIQTGFYADAQNAIKQAQALGADPAAALLYLARTYRLTNDPATAVHLLRKAIKYNPRSIQAHTELAGLYLDLDQHNFAEKTAKRVIYLDGEIAEVHVVLGETALFRQDLDQATERFEVALKLDEELAAPYIGLARIYHNQGQLHKAIAYYEQAAERVRPNDDFPFTTLADLYADIGLLSTAIRTYEMDPAKAAVEPRYHLAMGNVALRDARWLDALQAFQAAIERDESSLFAYLGLAAVGRNTQDTELMVHALERADQLQPLDAPYMTELGDAYFRLRKYGESIHAYEQAITRNPTYVPSHFGLGVVHKLQHALDDAQQDFEKVIQLEPEHIMARLYLSDIYMQQGRLSDADQLIAETEGVETDPIQRNLTLASLRRHQGDVLQSRIAYDTILHLVPNHPQALVGAASLSAETGDLDEAHTLFEKAVVATPDSVDPIRQLGFIRLLRSDYVGAQLAFERAASLGDESAELALLIGQTYAGLGHDEAAADCFQQGVDRDPQLVEAQTGLAQTLLRLGRWEDAYDLYEGLTELLPNNLTIWKSFGWVAAKLNRLAEAISAFEHVLAIDETAEPAVDALIGLADAYVTKGDLDAALSFCLHAAQRNPLLAEVQWRVGHIFRQQGAHDNAQKAYRVALKRDRDCVEAWLGLGILLHEENRSEARNALRRVIQLLPSSEEAYIRLGQIEFADGNLDEALTYFHLALRQRPEDPQLLQGVAELYIQAERIAEAHHMYQSLVTIADDAVAGWLGLAQIAQRAERWSEAAENYQSCLARDGENAIAALGLAQSLFKLDQFEVALAYFKQATDALPESTAAKIGLGRCYFALHQYDEALSEFDELLQDDPEQVEVLLLQARTLQALGHEPGAQTAYRKLLQLRPGCKEAHVQLGLGHLKRYEYREAIEMLTPVADHDRYFKVVNIALGTAHNAFGQYDQARRAFQLVMDRGTQDPSVFNGLARAETQLGNADDALQLCQRSIELDPKRADTRNELGNTLHALGRLDEALAAFERARRLDPKIGEPHIGIGQVYMTLHRFHEAITAFERAVRQGARSSKLYVGLGKAYLHVRDKVRAKKAFETAIEINRADPLPYCGLGNLYHDDGNYKAARTAYRYATEVDDQCAPAFAGLADIADRFGELDQARTAYERAISLKPNDVLSRASLARLYRKMGRVEDYEREIQKARELIRRENEYNRACFEAICGHKEEALKLLRRALSLRQVTPEWANNDPDFDSIRSDPRFKALIGLGLRHGVRERAVTVGR